MDPLFSWIPEAGIIATWAYASQIYFTIAAFINPVVLSLNRFTGVVFFLDDKKVIGITSYVMKDKFHFFLDLEPPFKTCDIVLFNFSHLFYMASFFFPTTY